MKHHLHKAYNQVGGHRVKKEVFHKPKSVHPSPSQNFYAEVSQNVTEFDVIVI